MANSFDQFDATPAETQPDAAANPFDQFDEPATAPAAVANPFDQFDAPTATPQAGSWGNVAAEGAKGLARGLGSFAGTMGEAVMGPFGSTGQSARAMAAAPEPTAADTARYGSRANYYRSKITPSYG